MPNSTVLQWSPEDEAKARSVGHRLVVEECGKSAEGKEFLEIYRTVLWDLGYKNEAMELGYSK